MKRDPITKVMTSRRLIGLGLVCTTTLGAASASAQLATNYQSLINGTTGLQNYWTFEDVGGAGNFSTVADIQSGKNGVAVGTVESQTGLIGFAGYFPGDTDNAVLNNYIAITGSDVDPAFNLAGSFTVEALVMTNTLPAANWSGIVTKGDSAWRISRNSSGDWIQSAANGLAGGISNAFHELDNGIWHYVALSYDATTGVQTSVFDDAVITATTTPGNNVSTNAFLAMIGANAQRAEREWLGFIDEVAIYNVALTPTQFAARTNLLDTDPGAIDQAAIAFWTGAQPSGSFSSNAGWDTTAPQPGDSVIIGKGGTVSIGPGDIITVKDLEVGSTTDIIGQDSDGTGTLVITGGSITITGDSDGSIGKGTTGAVIQSGGEIIFNGIDYELGEDANGMGTHTMTGGLLQIGVWVQDNQFSGGWWMTNDPADSSGDDLSLGRRRPSGNADNTGAAKGVLDMSGNAEVRVSNDVFLDAGIGELYMTDNAVFRVGDDFRAASADYGTGLIDLSGNANLMIEGRFSIADSTATIMDVTLSGNAKVQVEMYTAVGGQDNLQKSGIATLTLEDSAQLIIGSRELFLRGDVDGLPPAVPVAYTPRVADEQELYVGAGNNGAGSGTVNQNGANTLVSVGRQAFIGEEALGVYNLRGGTFEVRGDAPATGITAGYDNTLRDFSNYADQGGDLFIGFKATGNGRLSVEGGNLDVARDVVVGIDGTGVFEVIGDSATINIGGDLGVGGDFSGAAAQLGTLRVVLNDGTPTVINVNGGAPDGGGGTVPGDVYLYSANLEVELAGPGYRPSQGDQIVIVDFAGQVLGDGMFANISPKEVDGIVWNVIYGGPGTDIRLVATTVYLLADLDYDGDVDDADFGISFAAFTGPGSGPSANPSADLDKDGDVDDADFGVAFAAFTGPGGPASVPEPTSLALLALGGLTLARRRRWA